MAYQSAVRMADGQMGIDIDVDVNGIMQGVRYWNTSPRTAFLEFQHNQQAAKKFSFEIPAGTQTTIINFPGNFGKNHWTVVNFAMSMR